MQEAEWLTCRSSKTYKASSPLTSILSQSFNIFIRISFSLFYNNNKPLHLLRGELMSVRQLSSGKTPASVGDSGLRGK